MTICITCGTQHEGPGQEHCPHWAGDDTRHLLKKILHEVRNTNQRLERVEQGVTKIMATEQQVVDALNKIDAATTKVATNLTVVAQVTQTISDEMDALETALQNAGVPQALVDQASALGDRAQAASDALDAQVPVLQAIATKGVINPVPVTPPVVTAPTDPTAPVVVTPTP